MNELELFAGCGGGILAGELAGDRCVGAVELDSYCREVLMARQDDGTFPVFPIWDDVRTFDGRPFRGVVDSIAAGFPCVGVSPERNNTLLKRPVGIEDPQSGLYWHALRIVREVEPGIVRLENHPNLTKRGLDQILCHLAALGFNAEWDTISARSLGAPHERKRIWINATHPDRAQPQGEQLSRGAQAQEPPPWCNTLWQTAPEVYRVDDGVANGPDRLRAIGNGQVPIVAALAWETLKP
jgi:DNA (cytosine-5)-methyltransferase 1